jgi:ABC-type multidrug transport system ATPase subunit
MKVLEVKDIKKSFEEKEILKGISFQLGQSEIYGLLGPNGAGKTTSINIILGLLKETSGQIEILGECVKVPFPKNIKQRLGYIPDEPILMNWLTPTENIIFTAHLYNVKLTKEKALEYLKKFSLYDKRDLLVEKFSKGMKQKLMLATQLTHNPEIIILDEPTVGLDPVSNNQLKKILRKYKEEGKSIIISSHDMIFTENLCDRVGIMLDGKIRIEGTIQEILSLTNSRTLEDAVVKVLESNVYKGDVDEK